MYDLAGKGYGGWGPIKSLGAPSSRVPPALTWEDGPRPVFISAAEFDRSGALVAKYAQGAGIDEPLAMNRQGSTVFYDADGLGSVVSLADGTGATTNTYTYDAFGKRTNTTGTIFNPFQYTGRENDPETGLYYYRARLFDPEISRFISEDPFNFDAGDENFYRYVANNPTNWIDSWGLYHCQPGAICNFTPEMRDALTCFDACTHRDTAITSGRRPGGGQHGRGTACDVNRRDNPDLTRDDAVRCTRTCFGEGYGQEEHNGPDSSDPNGTHFHEQLYTIPGGRPGFAPTIRPYQPSPPAPPAAQQSTTPRTHN